MKSCCRKDGGCDGRITWEHPWIYGGKQINESWALVPLCVYHHLGAGFDKDYGRWISLNRANRWDLAKYPRVNWPQLKEFLDAKYKKLSI
jgi:hypothetical protein